MVSHFIFMVYWYYFSVMHPARFPYVYPMNSHIIASDGTFLLFFLLVSFKPAKLSDYKVDA